MPASGGASEQVLILGEPEGLLEVRRELALRGGLLEDRLLASLEVLQEVPSLLDGTQAFLARVTGLVAPEPADELGRRPRLEQRDDGADRLGRCIKLGFEPLQDGF